MSAILNLLLSSNSSGLSFTNTVGTAGSSNGVTSQTFWGYSIVGFTNGNPESTYYPDFSLLAMGATSPTGLTISGNNLLGVYSLGINSTNIATYYVVVLAGNVQSSPGLVNNLSIDGTPIVYTSKTVLYVAGSKNGAGGSLPSTYFLFQLTSSAATLFGTTAGATKTVSIS